MELWKQLRMGYEYCYEAMKSPEKYHINRSSNRRYCYEHGESYILE